MPPRPRARHPPSRVRDAGWPPPSHAARTETARSRWHCVRALDAVPVDDRVHVPRRVVVGHRAQQAYRPGVEQRRLPLAAADADHGAVLLHLDLDGLRLRCHGSTTGATSSTVTSRMSKGARTRTTSPGLCPSRATANGLSSLMQCRSGSDTSAPTI